MLEILILAVLLKVFWSYGKNMGTGKWLSVGIYLLSYVASAQCGLGLFASLIAIIPTCIILMLLSSMQDRQRIRGEREKRLAEQNRMVIPQIYPGSR